MKELLGFTVIGGMIAFLIWGLLNPGKINHGDTRTPAPPEVLIGGLIFVTMCGELLVLKSMDRLNTIPLIVIISVAMGGWMFAAIAARRDARKRKLRDESGQTRP
jgi:hypothetical protein